MAERDTIRLLTLTRLWLFSRYLYRIGEWRLMVPLSHRALGYGLAVFVPLWIILQWANVSTGSALGMFAYGAIPAGIVWWALHLVGEGARPHELVTSWARYARGVVHGRRVVPVRVGGRTRSDVGRPAVLRERGDADNLWLGVLAGLSLVALVAFGGMVADLVTL